jgi:hypothetical protein
MTKRAEPEHHRHLLGLAHLEEAAQVTPAAPVEETLLFFDMVPKHVGGDDGHTPLFHLAHLGGPLIGRYPAVMYLAHDRQHTVPVEHQAARVPCHSHLLRGQRLRGKSGKGEPSHGYKKFLHCQK